MLLLENEVLGILLQLRLKNNHQGLSEEDFESAMDEVQIHFHKIQNFQLSNL